MEGTNYREMYYLLSQTVADVIEHLTEKQIELEEMYLNQDSENELRKQAEINSFKQGNSW
ncbi:MAG: hypothetical protein IKW59_01140 [Clostridia bacterium]|nr:hypothetical protein [Clostridia bacterium]